MQKFWGVFSGSNTVFQQSRFYCSRIRSGKNRNKKNSGNVTNKNKKQSVSQIEFSQFTYVPGPRTV